jgi:mRNA deadenylase 3'-5' endonuclease subunit Ccr4
MRDRAKAAGGFLRSEILIEAEDFYDDEMGRMVFTEKYHLKRGYCCQKSKKTRSEEGLIIKFQILSNHAHSSSSGLAIHLFY